MNAQQEVDLVVFSDEECDSIHGGKPHPTNICAGVPEGGKGQCSVRETFLKLMLRADSLNFHFRETLAVLSSSMVIRLELCLGPSNPALPLPTLEFTLKSHPTLTGSAQRLTKLLCFNF